MFSFRPIITALLLLLSAPLYAQIINDRGATLGKGMMAPMSPTAKPIVPENKPMQKQIQHTELPPMDENKYSLSRGRKKITQEGTDGYERIYQVDAIPEKNQEGSARKYFGTIEIISVVVDNGETQIKLVVPPHFSKWVLVSNRSVVIDRDAQKRYPITGVHESVGMANTFAVNLTRYKERYITLTFPPLDEQVLIIDLVLPIPSQYDIEQLATE